MSKLGNGCQNIKCNKSDCRDIFCGVQREVPIYPALNSEHKEVHALFYYYLLAHKQLEEQREGAIVYEGDPDPVYDYIKLVKHVAILYEVDVEYMLNAWPAIDEFCAANNLPLMPNSPKYRHHMRIIVP